MPMGVNDAHPWLPTFMQQLKHKLTGSEESHGPREERDRLLPKSVDRSRLPGSPRDEGESYDPEDDQKSQWRLIWDEYLLLFKTSMPVIMAYALQNSLQTVSVVIVGRDTPHDLATAAFAYMFAMCTGWLIALGGTTALDTLAAVTYTGSSDPHDLGILLQRAFIILGLFYIPVVIIWVFAEPLFLALGQSAKLSHDSARFLWCLAPGGLGYIYFECVKKYLQAQGKMHTSLRILAGC